MKEIISYFERINDEFVLSVQLQHVYEPARKENFIREWTFSFLYNCFKQIEWQYTWKLKHMFIQTIFEIKTFNLFETNTENKTFIESTTTEGSHK